MKKLTFFISIIIIFVGIIYLKQNNFFKSPTAYAVGDLTVNWGVTPGLPIFTITNAAPGFSQTKTVQITNGATTVRPLGIKAQQASSNPSNFPIVLKVKITEGATVLYEKTLQQFYLESVSPNGVPLGNINSGATRSINILITFDIDAGNEFQNASAVFNLIIGLVSDIPAACSNMTFNGPTIFGTQGGDKITATSKNEMIILFEGNDRVDASSGNDCIIGLSGIKEISAGSGNDVISTGDGNNKLNGESGNDVIFSGNGNNNVTGGAGEDLITLGNGTNKVEAESGDDIVIVGTGNNNITSGAGNDKVTAGGGNNKIDGESGNDNLNNGNASTGTVNGSSGKDTCVGLVKTLCEL